MQSWSTFVSESLWKQTQAYARQPRDFLDVTPYDTWLAQSDAKLAVWSIYVINEGLHFLQLREDIDLSFYCVDDWMQSNKYNI